MKNEPIYLQELSWQVAEKFGHENPELWPNGIYLKLSQEIFDSSGIVISASTLKRIYGKVSVDSSYDPQTETKNALAIYAGYQGWEDYLRKKEPSSIPSIKVAKKPRTKRILWIALSCLIIIFTLFLFFRHRTCDGKLSVYLDKQEAEVPYTAIYHLKCRGDFPTSAYLIVEKDTILLNKAQDHYSRFFKLPGLVKALLVVQDRVVQEIPLLIKSGGIWKGYAHYDFSTHQWVPCSTLSHEIYQAVRPNSFFTKDDIRSFGFVENRFYMTEYRYFEKTGIQMDTMTAEFSILNHGSISAIFCDHLVVKFHCKGGLLSFRFVKTGCTRWAEIVMGDNKLTGEFDNLDFMGGDFSRFRNIKVCISGKHLTLLLDGKIIFKSLFDNRLKELYGMSFHFTGLGEFSDVTLRNNSYSKVIPSIIHQ